MSLKHRYPVFLHGPKDFTYLKVLTHHPSCKLIALSAKADEPAARGAVLLAYGDLEVNGGGLRDLQAELQVFTELYDADQGGVG